MYTKKDNSQEDKKTQQPNKRQEVNNKGAFHFEDNTPQAIQMRKFQEMANNSPQTKQLKALQEMANNHAQVNQLKAYQTIRNNTISQIVQREENLEEEETIQEKAEQPIQKKKNNTGLPDNLKSGIENLSGYSMDDVKVHYNSEKPAQLHAHAYAQGTEIHVASGQEKHLPHEAWHVVQQKQGRVKPTMQMKGNISINDNAGLEKEADLMGENAMQKISFYNELKTVSQKKSIEQQKVIQRMKWSDFVKNFPNEKDSRVKTGFWENKNFEREPYTLIDEALKDIDMPELDTIAEELSKNPKKDIEPKHQRKYENIPEKEKQDIANVIMLTRATLGMPLNKRIDLAGKEREIANESEMSDEQKLVKGLLHKVEDHLLGSQDLDRNQNSQPRVVLILAVASDIVGGGVCDNFASLAAVYSKKLCPDNPIWLISTGGHRYAATGISRDTLDHQIDAWDEKEYSKRYKPIPGSADNQEFNIEQLDNNYEELREEGEKYYYSLLDKLTLPELILLAARLEKQIADLVKLLGE